MKKKPVDFSHEFAQLKQCQNKVMLNIYDNGRCYDFDASSEYNLKDQSLKQDLIWIQFKEKTNVAEIEQLIASIGLNSHIYKDSSKSCIVNLEDKGVNISKVID